MGSEMCIRDRSLRVRRTDIEVPYKEVKMHHPVGGWRSLENGNDDLPVSKVDPARSAEFKTRSEQAL